MEVGEEVLAWLHRDDPPFLRPDLLEQGEQELAALRGLCLDLPEAGEVAEQLAGPVDAGVSGGAEALQLLLDHLAAHDVLRFRQVAEDVEVLQPGELAVQLAAAGARGVALWALGLDCLHHQLDQPLVGGEVADPADKLVLQAFGEDDRLAAGVAVAARRAHVAAGGVRAAARAVHSRAAALAAQELAQQVLLGGRARLQYARPPSSNLLHALEQLLGEDRLVQALRREGGLALAGDVAAVGGVGEDAAHGVLAEGTAAGGAGAGGVQPLRDRQVRLLAGGVALEGFEHERRNLGVGHRELVVRVAHVAPGQQAREVALTRLLPEAAAHPEGERDGVVLVEHLVDRLGEEGGGVGVVFAHGLRDGDDADAECLAEHLLIAAGLDLVAGEARGVKDEHDVELALGGVGHQPLELGSRGGLAPTGVEVAVLPDQQ